MSNENIFFTLEEELENKYINENENKNEIPCFCQGENLCVFCMKEKDVNKEFDLNEDKDFYLIEDEVFSKKINYNVNFTVKQLSMICDYYGILKGMKSRGRNKNDLIECLVAFENDPSNSIIVLQRKKCWFYLEELKKDSFLKKYIWANF